MSTRQQTQLLHLNHNYDSKLTLVVLVVVSSWLMGLAPLVCGLNNLNLIDTQEANLVIPNEAGLWSPLRE